MSTHNIHLKYRTPKRYPTIISIVPPGVALLVTVQGSNYRCLEQIFMVPKWFEPSKFDCSCSLSYNLHLICKAQGRSNIYQQGASSWNPLFLSTVLSGF